METGGTSDVPKVLLTGSFIPGKTPHDSYAILLDIFTSLLQLGKKLVIVGGGLDIFCVLSKAVIQSEGNCHPVYLDAELFIGDSDAELNESNAWNKIFLEEKIVSPVCMGLQQYFCNPVMSDVFTELGGHTVRLAEIIQQSPEAEAYLRTANAVGMSARVLAMGYQNEEAHISPNGINARESCQILKDAGLSPKANAYILTDFYRNGFLINPQYFSQMLWHLLDGISIQLSHPKETEEERYHILIGQQNFTFTREVFHNRWWVSSESKNDAVPCTQRDYEWAKAGELSPRLKTLIS